MNVLNEDTQNYSIFLSESYILCFYAIVLSKIICTVTHTISTCLFFKVENVAHELHVYVSVMMLLRMRQ